MSTGAIRFGGEVLSTNTPGFDAWLRAALAPVASGLTSRELVIKAIEFQSPVRIPYSFVDPVESDFFELAELERQLEGATPRLLGDVYRDPWGATREASQGLFDRVLDYPLADLSRLSGHEFPSATSLIDPGSTCTLRGRSTRGWKICCRSRPGLLFERLRDLMGFSPCSSHRAPIGRGFSSCSRISPCSASSASIAIAISMT